MRTDPTDTGGLFVGRRPGTAPTRYGAGPRLAGPARRRLDALAAAGFTGAELRAIAWDNWRRVLERAWGG